MAKKNRPGRKGSASKKSSKSRKKKKRKTDTKIKSAIVVIVIIILALIIIYSDNIFMGDKNTVAEVNGQKVSTDELNNRYDQQVSVEYREILTKELFLNQTLIPQILFLQEAEKEDIAVSNLETQSFIDAFLTQSSMTKEELEEQIKEEGMSYNEFLELYSERLKIVKLLNRTIGTPEVSDEETKQFYEENMASFSFENQTLSYEEAEEQIKSFLLSQKQQEEVNIYLNELREKSEIKIYKENIAMISGKATSSFQETGDPVCYEDGKPIIRLYSTTTCPHCRWIKETFDSVAMEYVAKGQIIAYHWEFDTKDNTLTKELETGIPQEGLAVLQRYGTGGVPLFVFGCRYVRIGNAYEMQDDLEAEKREFRSVIDSLLAV